MLDFFPMRFLPLIFVAAVTAGCSSVSELEDADPDEGFERFYAVAHTRALAAVRDSLSENNFVIREEEEYAGDTWRFMAFQRAGAASTGRNARVMVVRTPKHVTIRVMVKSRLGARARSMGDGDAAMAIHSGIERSLR